MARSLSGSSEEFEGGRQIVVLLSLALRCTILDYTVLYYTVL